MVFCINTETIKELARANTCLISFSSAHHWGMGSYNQAECCTFNRHINYLPQTSKHLLTVSDTTQHNIHLRPFLLHETSDGKQLLFMWSPDSEWESRNVRYGKLSCQKLYCLFDNIQFHAAFLCAYENVCVCVCDCNNFFRVYVILIFTHYLLWL